MKHLKNNDNRKYNKLLVEFINQVSFIIILKILKTYCYATLFFFIRKRYIKYFLGFFYLHFNFHR